LKAAVRQSYLPRPDVLLSTTCGFAVLSKAAIRGIRQFTKSASTDLTWQMSSESFRYLVVPLALALTLPAHRLMLCHIFPGQRIRRPLYVGSCNAYGDGRRVG
jgi:hypothetical protein